jgi:hypothetical protein
MAHRLAFALAVVPALLTAAGCTSTGSNPGAVDGSAMIPDGQSGAAPDASGSAECVAAGGQCVPGGGGPCTLVGPEGACDPDRVGGAFCCAASPDAICIEASSYDQWCTSDQDCVGISSNASCLLCGFNCPNAAINVDSQGQYLLDTADSTARLTSLRTACTGDCTIQFGPCCVGGMCQMGGQCPAPVSSLTCALGAACSMTQTCAGGIAGCTSNCQCLDGEWQAPCPADLPQTGSSCTPEGAECGYTTSTNACGAQNCDCKGGTWSCGATCVIDDASAGADTGADGAAEGGRLLDAGGE